MTTRTTNSRERLVVIGNGMAGVRLLEELVQRDAGDQYEILVFGSETTPGYNRILLSPLLSGDKTLEQIRLRGAEWYDEQRIALRLGTEITDIDAAKKQVFTADGEAIAYDKLILATGSNPFIIPLPGHRLEGVISFRDLADVDTMLAASEQHEHAVIIGGGLLGLEAADGLHRRGMKVTVVHIAETIMDSQLDQEAAGMLREALESRGIKVLTEAFSDCIIGDDRATGLRFKDGSEIPADLIVMTAGVRPNIALANDSGLLCERAIVVDDHMRSSDENIYAVGECAEHRGACYGLVAPLYDQAKILAEHLLHQEPQGYEGSQLATTLKVSGVNLYSAGDFNGDGELLIFRDPGRKVYKKLVVRDNQLVGAVMYGEMADGPWYFDLIQSGEDISAMRSRLIFGRQYAEIALAEAA